MADILTTEVLTFHVILVKAPGSQCKIWVIAYNIDVTHLHGVKNPLAVNNTGELSIQRGPYPPNKSGFLSSY